jgi:hypothetical protein
MTVSVTVSANQRRRIPSEGAMLTDTKSKAANNHSDHLQERQRMMQAWADYLDGLCSGANVTSIRRSA